MELFSSRGFVTLISIHGESHTDGLMARADWVYVILSSEVFKVVCITNKKTVSIHASYGQCFFLGTCFHSYFNSSLQDPLQCLKSLFRVYGGRFLSYRKKKKDWPKWPLVVIRWRSSIPWHSLSLVVPLRWRSLCLVVALVVACCAARCDSLSLVVAARCRSVYCPSVFSWAIIGSKHVRVFVEIS